ncbi:DUF397 domain-containing protein [Streptomyces sp. NPDC005752]|uniref:DUF397 domain-containing protein n=1 Tax=Streptomyces sp. NPDC005752 TaxID=3157065 RepID=UPI0033D49D59
MHSIDPTVTDDGTLTGWRKSSYSGGANGECIEVAHGCTDVPVRDSKAPRGPVVVFSTSRWTTFVAAVVGGHFDV